MLPTTKRIRASLKSSFFVALMLGVAGHASLGRAQPPGTFSATGSMKMPRIGHTATLLADGRVLIAGGISSPVSAEASAELYDPATGTFTATGNMTTPRQNHAAALLPDGRVLIVGGSARSIGGGQLTGAELYDPSTGTFTGVASLRHLLGTVTVLPNGQVLVTTFGPGGITGVEDFKLFDPSSGTVAPAADVVPDHIGFLAILLANGKVLFANGDGYPDVRGQLYDPATHTFSPADDIDYFTATLLMNGNVLFVGEYDDESRSTRTAYLYYPSTGTFTTTGNTTEGGAAGTATLLGDGTVLIAAGPNASAELYDPVVGSFSDTGTMTMARNLPRATLLNNGQVLITGGYVFGPLPLTTAELYTPPVLAPAPVLLSLSGDGRGQGAIQHGDTYQLVAADNPAVAGDVILIYCTGLSDGSLIPPQVAIGGRLAEIQFFGKTPGFAGLSQVNVRVPSGVAPGSAVPVRLTYIGRTSNQVTIGVR